MTSHRLGARVPAVLALVLLLGVGHSGVAHAQGDLREERIYLHDESRSGPLSALLNAVSELTGEDDPARRLLLETLRGVPAGDQFVAETGARVGGAIPELDIQSVVLAWSPTQMQAEFSMAGMPLPFTSYIMAFRLPRHDDGWTRDGSEFMDDVLIVARRDGGGGFTLGARLPEGDERAIGGTVEVERAQVRIRLPLTTVAGLGLARPGIRIAFRVVGPPPMAARDRAPESGSIQIGLAGRWEVDQAAVREQVDVEGDGRADLFYFDSDRNGLIDAAGRDRNADGRIDFLRAEGPGRFVGRDGRPLEFPRVERLRAGRRAAYRLSNAHATYMTVVEDKNEDGDVDDADEFRGFYIPRR